MTTNHAQLISLVSHGNHFLQTGGLDAGYYPENSTFQFCNSVQFTAYRTYLAGLWKTQPVYKEIPEWLHSLKQESCQRLQLYYTPTAFEARGEEHMTAGLIGGAGRWMIQAMFDDYSHFWEGHWEVTKKDAEDRRIWSVEYKSDAKKYPARALHYDLSTTRQELHEALTNIAEFAYRYHDGFGSVFDKALEALNDRNPVQFYYHKDLMVQEDYSLEQRQVLFAAASAWVFGGMGSWNDTGFEDPEVQKRYKTVTRNLYRTINQGIIAAVNQ